jgi:enoyl-CoA hydratase
MREEILEAFQAACAEKDVRVIVITDAGKALTPATKELAQRIAENAPIPVALANRGLQHFYRMDLAQTLDDEAFAIGICANGEDRKEGFKAFLEKREPNFIGE